ncbi:MAG: NTP transferase domain-containing protein [Clostridiales bacterium]|nr:NTP transferase domain-containing protein [Clostridiales bacterium]
MLTKKQFELLERLTQSKKAVSQRALAAALSISVGNVNKIMGELTEQGLVEKGSITAKGLDAMEPYRVKTAVFIAAGFGSRMVPITLNTPKPLVRVNGKRIIDSLLDAVIAVGITNIYIVRGYLGEQFDQLLYKYPTIKFIENPIYNESNNISSVMCASYLLKNAYVMEGDLLLYNPDLIKPYQYESNYLGVPVEKTDDWCFEVNSKGVISKLSVGCTNCFHMFGISYWNEADGAKLVGHVKDVYQAPGGKERYWDQVALEYHKSEYSIHVRQCTFNDITEIDTFNELKRLDKTYDI